MARGINKVIIIGNLGQDPDIRTTRAGAIIANLSVATDESYKDKQTGQLVPRTEWHRVVYGNRLAEIARDYLRKGSKVYVEGRLITRKWQDETGADRYTTEIRGNELQMLDSRQDNQGGQGYQASAQAGPGPGNQSRQAGPGNQGHQAGPGHTMHSPAPQASPMANAPRNHAQQQQESYGQSRPQSSSAPAPVDDFDDDIPF